MEQLYVWKHFLFTIGFFVLLYVLSSIAFKSKLKGLQSKKLIRQLTLAGIALIGFVAVILAIPMGDVMKSNITSLLGIVISAVLALSSTTFIGNAFAGIFHKMVGTFKPGDMIQTDQYFGKVTEQGLFHTEIQDISSNLVTIPNLYLVNHPVEVFRPSGTIISAEVSLGYDIHHSTIEVCLLEAAKQIGLEAPFVYVKSLGDFSVLYQVNGLLKNVNTLPSKKSQLHTAVMDSLHAKGIEIVSPTFMNQRQISGQIFIPKSPKTRLSSEESLQESNPENIIFDKAEKAESIEKRKEIKHELDAKINEIEQAIKGEKDNKKVESLKARLKKLKDGREKLVQKIDEVIEKFEEEK